MVRIPDNFQSRLPNVGAPTGAGRIDTSTATQEALAGAGRQLQQFGDQMFQQSVTEQASKLELQGQQQLEQLQNEAIQQEDFRTAPDTFRERAKNTVSEVVNRANPTVQAEVRGRLARQAATMTSQLRERSVSMSRDATEAAVNNQLQALSKQYAQTDRPTARKELRSQMQQTAERLRSAGLTGPEVEQQQRRALATADAARVQQLLNQDKVDGASEFLAQSEDISVDQTRILKNRIDAKRREVNQRLRGALQVAEDHFMSTGQLPKVNVGPFETLEEFENQAEGTEVGRALRGLRNNASFIQNHGSKSIVEQQQQIANLQGQAQRDPKVRRRMELAKRTTRAQVDALQSDDPYGAAAQLGLISAQPNLPLQSAAQGADGGPELAEALNKRIEAQQSLTAHLTGQRPDDATLGGQVDLLKESEREQLQALLDSQPAAAATTLLQQMSQSLGPDGTRKLAGSLAKQSNIVGFAAQVAGESPSVAKKALRGRAAADAGVKVPGEADTEFRNAVGRSLSIQARQRVRPVTDAIYKTMVIDQDLDPNEFHADQFQKAARLAVGGTLDSSGEVRGGPVEVNGRVTLPPRRGMEENETRDAFEALAEERNAPAIQNHANGLPARVNSQGEFEQLNLEDLEDAQPRHVGGGRYVMRFNQDGKAIHAVDPQTGEPRGAFVINMRDALDSGDLQTKPREGKTIIDIPLLGEINVGSTGVAEEFGTEPNQPQPIGRGGPGQRGQTEFITPGNTGPPIRQGFGSMFSRAFRGAVDFLTEDDGGDPGVVTVDVPSRPPRGVGQTFQDRAVPKPGNDADRPPIPPTKTREVLRALQAQVPDMTVNEKNELEVPDDVLRNVKFQFADERPFDAAPFQMPRGIRNNNPMNVKNFDIPWRGSIDNPTDETFEQFNNPAMGIRAGLRDLMNDHLKDGKKTIRGLIGEFAPESENPTSEYVNFVSNRVGVSPSAEIDFIKPSLLQDFVRATIEFENGIQPYSDRTIASGIAMAIESQPGA